MQQQHKQRLIGAVIVVALAVIFLPMVLQGPVDRGTTNVAMDIPPRPEVERGPDADPGEAPPTGELEAVPLPDEPDGEAAAGPGDAPPPEPDESVEPVPEDQDDPAAGAEPEEQPDTDQDVERVDDSPEPGDELASWAVQVGSFGQESNALGLRDRLREQEFSAYVDRVERDDADPVYRLRVGPVSERADAEALLDRLAEDADLDGLVVSHP